MLVTGSSIGQQKVW